jgi:hypothetical protein
MTTYTLNIDLDAPCPKCGRPGSVNNGLCLNCANRRAEKLHRDETRRLRRKRAGNHPEGDV